MKKVPWVPISHRERLKQQLTKTPQKSTQLSRKALNLVSEVLDKHAPGAADQRQERAWLLGVSGKAARKQGGKGIPG